MRKKITIAAQCNLGLVKQVEQGAEDLKISKSTYVRCAILHFLELPTKEQYEFVKKDLKRERLIALCAQKKTLQEKLEVVEKELKENDLPVKDET
jgi:hypothetical protein